MTQTEAGFSAPERSIFAAAGKEARVSHAYGETRGPRGCLQKGMTLAGAKVAMGANISSRSDIIIRYGRIAFTPRARTQSVPKFDLSGFMILPGLVNAHDHLEFNLFPRLGRGPYPNAVAWAEEIFKPSEEPIASHLRLPKHIRLWWGGLKNLLNGVTSVAHHNPYDPTVFSRSFPRSRSSPVRMGTFAHLLARY